MSNVSVVFLKPRELMAFNLLMAVKSQSTFSYKMNTFCRCEDSMVTTVNTTLYT